MEKMFEQYFEQQFEQYLCRFVKVKTSFEDKGGQQRINLMYTTSN